MAEVGKKVVSCNAKPLPPAVVLRRYQVSCYSVYSSALFAPDSENEVLLAWRATAKAVFGSKGVQGACPVSGSRGQHASTFAVCGEYLFLAATGSGFPSHDHSVYACLASITPLSFTFVRVVSVLRGSIIQQGTVKCCTCSFVSPQHASKPIEDAHRERERA